MHIAPDRLLQAHSVAEAFLFVSLTYCPRCRRRPVRAAGDLHRDAAAADEWRLAISCAGCGEASELRFAIHPSPTAGMPIRINPTLDRSRVIDLAGWLALFRTILDGAGAESNRTDARAMTLEAVQCLDEALRFFAPGAELPDETAFFAESSLQRFRDHPDPFRRSRLQALKGKLPVVPPALLAPSGGATRKRKWWKLWWA